jgi:hypothetical protein
MEREYKISHNIRGTRYDIKLTKGVKNTPGFAPEYYDVDAGTVCVKYDVHNNNGPFIQFFSEPPNFEVSDIEEILALLKRGYVEEDFKYLEPFNTPPPQ